MWPSICLGRHAGLPLQNFNFFVHHIAIRPIGFDPFCHTLQRLADDDRVGIDQRAGDDGLCPFILQIHLRDGDVELLVQARKERLKPSALFFERGAGGETEVDGEESEHFNSF